MVKTPLVPLGQESTSLRRAQNLDGEDAFLIEESTFSSETGTWREVNINLPEEIDAAVPCRFIFVNELVFVDLGCCSTKFLKLDFQEESG